MNRFKVVRDTQNKNMFFAVANRRFVNLATGKEIAKGLKSGLFSYKDTLEQKGTAWIFQGSVVKNSTIHGDAAVSGNSTIEKSTILGKIDIRDSDIDFSNIVSDNITSIVESRIHNFQYYGVSCGQGAELKIFKSKIYGMRSSGKVFLDNTDMIASTDCIFKDSNASGCTLVGNGIEIENSDINNIQVNSHTHILNSIIQIGEERKTFFYSGTRNYTYFSNAKILSQHDVRRIVASKKTYFICRREDKRFGITISSNKKKSFDFLKEFTNRYVFEKNYFKVENDFFEQIKDSDFLQKIIENEMSFLQKHIKEFNSIGPEKKKKIRDILIFDLITFAIQDQDNFRQRSIAFSLSKFNIKTKKQNPGNFFIFSTLIERELAGISANCMLHCYKYLKNNSLGFSVFSLCV